MKQLVGWLARAGSYSIFSLPHCARWWVASVLAALWFDILRIRRQVVLSNLAIAFPTWSERERVQVARQSLRHLGLNFVEYSLLPWLNKGNVHKYFEFHGLELFSQALAQKRGVLLLTLHLGHGDLAASGLAILGYPMVMVSKFFKLRWLNDLWFGMRERVGMRFIPPRNSSYALLRSLKQGAAVIIPLDQFTGPPIGVRSTFFGKETGTAVGLAVMAERSRAPVISVYTYRKPDGRHVVHFARVMDENPDVRSRTQTFNDELEGFVRSHPEQWMWLHRRWKRFVE